MRASGLEDVPSEESLRSMLCPSCARGTSYRAEAGPESP